jgi:sugar lactone lactonase YvrE
MFTKLFTSPRRSAGYLTALALLASGMSANAQSSGVVSGSPATVPHNEIYGAPWQTAVTNRGDFLLFDFKTSGLYEYPVNGGPEITVAAQGAIAGGFTDSGIAIDPRNNNIYLNNNFNGGLLEYPFDTATGKWDLPPVTVAGGLAGNLGGSCGNYFQSAGMAINDNGLLAVATENGCGVEIFTVPIDASGNFGSATPIVANMTKRAKTVAIDDAGNIFFTEDAGGPAGVLYIPAGTTGLTSDTTVKRIDPTLGNVQGVSVDAVGNAYIVDGTAGAYLVPFQSGGPNTAASILLSSIPAAGGPSIDAARGVIKIYLNRQEFGSTTAGSSTGTSASVTYTFNAAATPYSFVVLQNGLSGGFAVSDLSGCGITFTTMKDPMTGKVTITENPTTYAVGSSCALPLTFTPPAVGDVSASLLMLDMKGNVLSTTVLHGSATGALVVGVPATESLIGSALKTPSQVAVDIAGNVYVADSGLGKVLLYAKGSTATSTATSLGTGLTAPTGVAVDNTGNVYIADSGKLLEIPYGPTGLNAAGQITLKTGLGSKLKLAVDAIGDVFVADPDNQRVVRLRTVLATTDETDTNGLPQLSAIAANGAGDVYVASGQNLIRFSAAGRQTLLTSLSNANGLAVDASGSVYVTSASQTVRIPNEAGTLNTSHQAVLAPGVTLPVAVAVDAAGNAYVADGAGEDVDYLNASASLNLGKLGTTTATSTGNAVLNNAGNAPLNITGFSSTADYSVTSGNCVGTAIAVGLSCNATVTFNPGPGDQGTLSTQLVIQSNATNSPVGINVTGTGVALAASATAINVTKPTVTSAPVIVNVTSVSGTGPVPTGNVTVTVTGTGIQPIVSTQPLVNGTVTINETTVPAGSFTFTAKYIGDRVYGTSTASTSVTVGKGAASLVQPDPATVPVYVLAAGAGSQEPYDGSQIPYYYNYPVKVVTANGSALVGVPIVNSGGSQTGTDYGLVTYTVAGGTPVCTGTSSTINVQADGTAPFPASCLGINTSNNQIPNLITSYTITPIYTDVNYTTVTGTPVTLIALRNPMVAIKSNPGSLTVAAGSSVTSNLTLTSLLGYGVTGINGNLNNYSLPVEMGCDALPAHATCSFSYPTPDPSDANSVAVNPTKPGNVIMTINTNVGVGTSTAGFSGKQGVLAAIFSVGLLGLALSRRRKLRGGFANLLSLLLCSVAVLGLGACSSANISAVPVLTTPKGTYTITVTAKQTGSKTVPNPNAGGAPITVYGNGNQVSVPFTMSVTIQ